MASLKEVVLQSLEQLGQIVNHLEVCKFIQSNNSYDFSKVKIPAASVSVELGNFIRQGDTRVKMPAVIC